MPLNFCQKFKSWLAACLAAGSICIFSGPDPVKADNWQAQIYEYGAPGHLVGVDKKKGIFNFFEKKSPFKRKFSYPCVTGQVAGDKQQINDLRTPEGIYFVEYKIANGLDFREYGGIAYTLNYPNPVDRLRGKTGHGIWIHSKGFDLLPTRGCVAIGRENIAEVGPLLLPGTPVVLAEELSDPAANDDGNLAKLTGLMNDWSRAWESRSAKLFDFYDPDAYTRATENFNAFRLNKERLFKILSFIKIYNREIHAIEGPGYWVTWSEQFYTASNLSTEGIRRLYWQKSKDGKFRIVGMEWTPRDVGMAAAFKQGKLVAEARPALVSDASSEAPIAPKLDMPELAPEKPALAAIEQAKSSENNEEKGSLKSSLVALAENLLTAAEPLIPRRQDNDSKPDEIIWGAGKRLNEPAPSAKEEPIKPLETPKAIEPPARPTPVLSLPASPKLPQTDKLILNDNLKQEIGGLVKSWVSAMQARDERIEEFYDKKDYNRLPQALGVPKGRSLATTLQALKRDFKQPWLEIIQRSPEISVNGPVAHTRAEMLIVSPQGLRQGEQNIWWRKDASGRFRIVGSEFKPGAYGMEANYLDQVSDAVATRLEAWRKAWEKGDVAEYISFYAPNATQQGRYGAANIRKQKESLWGRVKPAKVRLTGLRVALDANGARADMTQAYEDASGHADKGVKTLQLRYDGQNWQIQREDWVAMPQTPAS